ncbi:MAG TPA: hypothetical protein VJV79_18185 [Polyangiaceae bacterium]|nr:hypothetical protein [Polyangiaceae bacterium]
MSGHGSDTAASSGGNRPLLVPSIDPVVGCSGRSLQLGRASRSHPRAPLERRLSRGSDRSVARSRDFEGALDRIRAAQQLLCLKNFSPLPTIERGEPVRIKASLVVNNIERAPECILAALAR